MLLLWGISSIATNTTSPSLTRSHLGTPTITATRSRLFSPTSTATRSRPFSPTATATRSRSGTATGSGRGSGSRTPTLTSSSTWTGTASGTLTPSQSNGASETQTRTPTPVPTPSPILVPSPNPTPSPPSQVGSAVNGVSSQEPPNLQYIAIGCVMGALVLMTAVVITILKTKQKKSLHYAPTTMTAVPTLLDNPHHTALSTRSVIAFPQHIRFPPPPPPPDF